MEVHRPGHRAGREALRHGGHRGVAALGGIEPLDRLGTFVQAVELCIALGSVDALERHLDIAGRLDLLPIARELDVVEPCLAAGAVRRIVRLRFDQLLRLGIVHGSDAERQFVRRAGQRPRRRLDGDFHAIAGIRGKGGRLRLDGRSVLGLILGLGTVLFLGSSVLRIGSSLIFAALTVLFLLGIGFFVFGLVGRGLGVIGPFAAGLGGGHVNGGMRASLRIGIA